MQEILKFFFAKIAKPRRTVNLLLVIFVKQLILGLDLIPKRKFEAALWALARYSYSILELSLCL